MGDGSRSGSGLMGDGGATGGTTLSSPAVEKARACAIAASYRASSAASALRRSSSSLSR